MSSQITPSLNSQIVKKAQQLCNEKYPIGQISKKQFNQAYNEAIKLAGYSPSYFKKIIREIGPEYSDEF